MTSDRNTVTARLDRALIGLRRLLSAPPVIDDADAPLDLSTVLVVETAASLPSPATITDLARALAITHSTASRFVTRAEHAGAVTRVPVPGNARSTEVVLTDAGHRIRQRATAFRHERLRRLLRDFSPKERADFADLLERFAAAHDHEAER